MSAFLWIFLQKVFASQFAEVAEGFHLGQTLTMPESK